MIVDKTGRRFRNLRVSLTAACNYACTYCVPDGKRLMSAKAELDAEELGYLVGLLIEVAGIDKVRVTGGEPLLSPKLDAFFEQLNRFALSDISITTNGQFLDAKLDELLAAGLNRINVSLDTLRPERFRNIARSGDLDTVLSGLSSAKAAGMKIKLNMVPLRSGNGDELLSMLDFALENDFELRYIELMRMGHLAHSAAFDRDFIGMDEILATIQNRYSFSRTDAPFDSTAVRFEVADGEDQALGVFGIIPNESEPFCSSCTRLRLSSDGYLFGCLSSTRSHKVVDLLEMPRDLALVRLQEILIDALSSKQPIAFTGGETVMKFIGG